MARAGGAARARRRFRARPVKTAAAPGKPLAAPPRTGKRHARQRGDNAMVHWVREIQFRADQRFGELSLKLEKAERGGPRGKYGLPNGGKSNTSGPDR
jgi:hypothetical protein